jgi:hypothetical protein
MGRPQEFLIKAAEFEALAELEKNDDVRNTYKSLAHSYRRLASFMEGGPAHADHGG